MYRLVPLVLLILSGCAAHYGFEWGDRSTIRVRAPYPVQYRIMTEGRYLTEFQGYPDRIAVSDNLARSLLRGTAPLWANAEPFEVLVGPAYLALVCRDAIAFRKILVEKKNNTQEFSVRCED